MDLETIEKYDEAVLPAIESKPVKKKGRSRATSPP
jgi:hypothetical protein